MDYSIKAFRANLCKFSFLPFKFLCIAFKKQFLLICFIITLNIKHYSSHNFQDIVTPFGHKVDMTISMLTWYRFFDKCVLRGFIDKNGIISIIPLKTHLSKKRYIVNIEIVLSTLCPKEVTIS